MADIQMTETRIEELSRRDNEIGERLDRAEVRFESRVEQRFTEIDKRLADIDHRKAIAVQTRWFLAAYGAILLCITPNGGTSMNRSSNYPPSY